MLLTPVKRVQLMETTTKMIGIRVSPEIHGIVTKVSKARGQNVSGFLRRVLLEELARLSFLPDEQKKALGFNQEKEESSND